MLTASNRMNLPKGGDVKSNISTEIPEPPSSLKLVGQARWYQLADIMVGRGTWSFDWIPALEHICRSYDQLSIIELQIQRLDTFLVYGANGVPKANPLLAERSKLDTFIQNQLNCFNLTPITSRGSYLPSITPGKNDPIRNNTRTNFQDE